MYKTYIYGWWEKVQDDSRLHGRYNIHGTDSNRFSSADPNMQQIPKTSVDPNIKKQLVAPPGYLYMAFDYSQAELRDGGAIYRAIKHTGAFCRQNLNLTLVIKTFKTVVITKGPLKIYWYKIILVHKLWVLENKF